MYWIDAPIPGRLAIAARPRAGDWLEDEIEGWRNGSIDIVVSLLEPNEVHDLGLKDERDLCVKAGLGFLSLPISDRGVPSSMAKTRDLVVTCVDRLTRGGGVLVHCRAGIGRSAAIAACILVALGDQPDKAFERITAARGVQVPDTSGQVDWVKAFTLA